MTDIVVKAYICGASRSSEVQYVSADEQKEAVLEEAAKTTVDIVRSVVPAGCSLPSRGKFIAEIMPTPEPQTCSGKCDYYENPDEKRISVFWGTLPGYGGLPAPWPEITFELPDSCMWKATYLIMFGPPSLDPGGKILTYVTPAGNGEIPEPLSSYDKKEVFTGGISDSIQIIQNEPVPGMRIVLRDYFASDKGTVVVDSGHTHWCPICFFGGKVTAINGAHGDPNVTYDVLVFNLDGTITLKATPTDFVNWEVGDWVFLITGSSNCDDVSRKEQDSLIKDCDGASDSGSYYILPIKIGDYGA